MNLSDLRLQFSNFGIVKHPGSGVAGLTTHAEDLNSYEQVDGSGTTNAKSGRFSRRDASTAQEQLSSKGFIHMKWYGKCEADKVSMGTFDVLPSQGGMFGLVFDNTFSKQTSKTATFVLLTYPTGAPPQGAHHLPNLQAGHNASKTSLAKSSPHTAAAAADSAESLHSHYPDSRNRALSTAARSEGGSTVTTHHTGTLLKRRRKKGQGYARRFFSLEYTTCTLSYYYNRKSSALRGAIPLSLAAIAADERRREISIDSGAEVWHLRTSNVEEFTEWAKALEKASRIARGLEPGQQPSTDRLNVTSSSSNPPNTIQEEDREWHQVETLVSRVVGTRDALRRLVKDMAAQKQVQRPSSSYLSPGETPGSTDDREGYFPAAQPERRSFWKRKPSASPLAAPTASALAVPSPMSAANLPPNGIPSNQRSQEERNTHDHCNALLADLDSVVAEFTNLISNSKRRRIPTLTRAATARKSLESTASTDEFFDAEAGDTESSPQVMIINRREDGDGEDSQESDADEASIHDSSSASSVEDDEDPASGAAALYPIKPKSLSPLPVDIAVERRTTIPPATCAPPSLIAFVRKNVGKDLSTISMHVSANEPTSLLQRVSEQLEYAQLLNEAAQQKTPHERLLYVTAFAISQYSVNRVNERVIRKPFNPLLGETFELLRTESEVPGGFRLLVEKVTHRPVRLAMHADSAYWSFTQSPAPTQKFWGKSAELSTEGRVRIALRLPDGSDEHYSWTLANMILHNVVMGEKYVDPTGSMAVSNDTTGGRANIEFVKPKGMWGGRGEEVTVTIAGPNGAQTGLGLQGTWNQSLRVVESGGGSGGHHHHHHSHKGSSSDKEIWRVGDLVPKAPTTYGMTHFAATLNEVTDVERGRLPPTDCRLRPDQRLAEEGKLDEAEEWKVKLEEAQRARRRDLEERGEPHHPRWFVKVDEAPEGEEVWRMKGGKEGYWDERSRGEWKGVEGIFDV